MRRTRCRAGRLGAKDCPVDCGERRRLPDGKKVPSHHRRWISVGMARHTATDILAWLRKVVAVKAMTNSDPWLMAWKLMLGRGLTALYVRYEVFGITLMPLQWSALQIRVYHDECLTRPMHTLCLARHCRHVLLPIATSHSRPCRRHPSHLAPAPTLRVRAMTGFWYCSRRSRRI